MGLFSASSITNATVTAADTPLTNTGALSLITAPVGAATSNLECQVEATAASITNAATAITNNAVATASTVAANLVATAVDSAVNAVANTAVSAIANAANSVVGMLTADAAAIANNVASSVGSLFNNTIASIGTVVKIPIPDPIASSFANGVPQSTLFATNSILSQMESVTLGALGAISSLAAGALSLINLPSQLLRYGVATAAELEAAITTQISQLGITAAYSPGVLLSSVPAPLVPGAGTAPTSTPVGCPCGPASYAGYTDFAALAAPIANALTGSATGLASFYNPYLSDATDANGNAIAGIPNTIAAGTVNQITSTLTNTLGVPGITVAPTPYAASQSLFDGLYAISAKLGLVAVIEQMAASPVLFGATTQAQARTLLSQTTTNPTLIATLLAAAGAQTTNLSPDWYQVVVSNSALTASDVSTVAGILTSLNTTTTAVFTTAGGTTPTVNGGAGSGAVTGPTVIIDATPVPGDGGPLFSAAAEAGGGSGSSGSGAGGPGSGIAGGTLTVWNTSLLAVTQPPVATGLLSTSPATVEGATAHSLPITGLPAAATVSLMTRGVPRKLTRNLRFVPLTPKPAKLLYGSLMSVH